MLAHATMKPLTIGVGLDVSNIHHAKLSYADADAIMMHAPASIGGGGTLTIEVSNDESATSASVWRTLQIGDPFADASPPPAAKSRVYYELSTASAFRLKASAVITGADAVWAVEKSYSL